MPEQLPSISQPSTSVRKKIVKSGRDATEAKNDNQLFKAATFGSLCRISARQSEHSLKKAPVETAWPLRPEPAALSSLELKRGLNEELFYSLSLLRRLAGGR